MLDNLSFSQRRVHTVGVGVLLLAVMLCATPVFAQELRHAAEVLKKTSGGPVSFGPFSLTCSTTMGGSGCKFVTASEGGIGKIVEGGDDTGSRFTWTREVTVLLVLTPSVLTMQTVIPRGFVLPCSAPSTGSSRTAAP